MTEPDAIDHNADTLRYFREEKALPPAGDTEMTRIAETVGMVVIMVMTLASMAFIAIAVGAMLGWLL